MQQPGDLALVPHGREHLLASEPGTSPENLFDLPREQVSERYEILRHGGGGAATSMMCAAVRFAHPAAQHLVQLLPRAIIIDTWSSLHLEWIQSTLRFMAAEVRELRPGGETVITRLADLPVRHYVAGWRMRVALMWLREDDVPLGDVALRLGYQSEAAFNRAFKRFIGVPPGVVRRKSGGQQVRKAHTLDTWL